MSFEIANTIAKQAKELNVSKSALVRKVLESYIKFYQESKAIGGPKLYDVEKSFSSFLTIIGCRCTPGPSSIGWNTVNPDKTDCDVIICIESSSLSCISCSQGSLVGIEKSWS